MTPETDIVLDHLLHAIVDLRNYREAVRKQQMFTAIHTVTELLRETCKLKYNRIYSEPRSDHYRVKIYQSNYPDLTTKKKHKLFAIVRIILQKSGFNVDIDTIYFDSEDIIFRVYDRK
jgi:hypothetical protein